MSGSAAKFVDPKQTVRSAGERQDCERAVHPQRGLLWCDRFETGGTTMRCDECDRTDLESCGNDYELCHHDGHLKP